MTRWIGLKIWAKDPVWTEELCGVFKGSSQILLHFIFGVFFHVKNILHIYTSRLSARVKIFCIHKSGLSAKELPIKDLPCNKSYGCPRSMTNSEGTLATNWIFNGDFSHVPINLEVQLLQSFSHLQVVLNLQPESSPELQS